MLLLGRETIVVVVRYGYLLYPYCVVVVVDQGKQTGN